MVLITKKYKLIALGAVVLFLVGYGYHLYSLKHFKPRLTTQEQTQMTTLFAETHTYCIGRYLIDLPRDFTVTEATVRFDKKKIVTQASYLPVFEQKIKLRQQELKQTLPRNKIDVPYLKGIHPINPGVKGVIFERNGDDFVPDVWRTLELYAYKEGLMIETNMDVRNESSKPYKEERERKPSLYENNISQKLDVLRNLVDRISKRDENIIPTIPGLCLPHAFLADPNESEQAFYGYIESNRYPNIKISFLMDNRQGEMYSMLERSGLINKMLPSGVTDLRKSAFELHGQNAEEWLREDLNTEVEAKRLFLLHLNEKQGGDSTPFIDMWLTQTLPDSTMSQAEVVELWDTIRSTWRLRPGAI